LRIGNATVRFPPFSRPYNLLYARPRSCAKSAGLSSQLLRHLGQIGAEHVIAGTFPSDEPNRRSQLSHALFNNWPEEWLTRYLSRGYLLRDPVFLRSKAKADPFYWDELIPFADADSIGCRILDEARECGLVQGFSAAIGTLDGQTVGFSVAGHRFEMDPDMRGMLALIANYAVGRALALRQREALQWASEGKFDSEIGEIMGISEHMRSARARLSAINRTQAVADAIRRGLIS
jgi:LuxR family transcriptional regulator, quorum-sensing system regulator BjaR1